MSMMSSAISGISAASARYDAAAASTVRDASLGNDIIADSVAQVDSKIAFEASVSLAKTSDEMMGTLLDITA